MLLALNLAILKKLLIKSCKKYMFGPLKKEDFWTTMRDDKRAVQLKIINEVAELILSTLDLKKLYDEVLNKIQQKFEYFHLSFWLLDRKTNDLVLTAHAGYEEPKVHIGYRLPVNNGILSWVVQNQKSRLVLNTSLEPDFVRLSPESAKIKSEVASPVKLHEQFIGVLDIESEDLSGFDDFDTLVLETIANHFAIAIHNARLYEEIKSFNSVLNQKVREKTEELRINFIPG